MDALEFLKERKRMCNYYSHCKGCPLDGSKCVIDSAVSDENCKRFAVTVEQWSKEHRARRGRACFWSSIRRPASKMMVCCEYIPA